MRVAVRVAVRETEYVSKCGTGVWCSEVASPGTIQFYVTFCSEYMSDMTHYMCHVTDSSVIFIQV